MIWKAPRTRDGRHEKSGKKACPTYKDLDFVDMHEGLYFDTETYNALMKTLQRDCRVSATLFWHFSNKKECRLLVQKLWVFPEHCCGY